MHVADLGRQLEDTRTRHRIDSGMIGETTGDRCPRNLQALGNELLIDFRRWFVLADGGSILCFEELTSPNRKIAGSPGVARQQITRQLPSREFAASRASSNANSDAQLTSCIKFLDNNPSGDMVTVSCISIHPLSSRSKTRLLRNSDI
ncbi:MAG: hypothetical protein WEB53_13550 [Akkermansiaceae bacterium]